MPVRRRKNKRSASGDLDAWRMYFSGGYDFLWELQMAGVPTNEYGQPSREDGEDAWHRLGAEFLAEPRHPDLDTPWALEEFGDPRRRRPGR